MTALGWAELISQRLDVMEELATESAGLQKLSDRVGVSRPTVSRALTDLTDAGFTEQDGDAYRLTKTGRLALAHHRVYLDGLSDIGAAEEALRRFPRDAAIPPAAVVGGVPMVTPPETPYQAAERLRATLREAETCHVVLPAVSPSLVRAISEHAVEQNGTTTVSIPPEAKQRLVTELPAKTATACAAGVSITVTDVPEFGVFLLESGDEVTAVVAAVSTDGQIRAVIETTQPTGIAWVRGVIEQHRGKDVTTEIRTAAENALAHTRSVLTPALERQGFVELTPEYFAESRIADPVGAWRTGLSLPEVYAGYAARRTTDTDEHLAASLRNRLADGEDCLLVGPPGSGKSTTLARVACDWYMNDRGPVIYREQGRGTAVDDPETLRERVTTTDGHVLVVVEDVVRPEANGLLKIVGDLTDRTDVSVLVDARETEWLNPPGDSSPTDTAPLSVVQMPSLTDRDYERLVERFRDTAVVDVDLAVDELRSEIRTRGDSERDGSEPAETLLFVHRLSLYVDPLADRESSLAEDVQTTVSQLQEHGRRAVDVALAANVLNVAGISIDEAVLEALETAVADSDDRSAARSVLDGRLFFRRDTDGTYRTVHEAWSVAFCDAVIDTVDSTTVARRFGRTVENVFRLADPPNGTRRASDGGSAPVAERIETRPAAWADDAIEQLYTAAEEHPRLVALFDLDGDLSVRSPGICESMTETECRERLGTALRAAGQYEQAKRVYTEMSTTAAPIRRPLGLAKTHFYLRDFEAAANYAEQAMEAARETGDLCLEVRSLRRLGTIADVRGDRDRAERILTDALNRAQTLGDPDEIGATLASLGVVAQREGRYEDAREYHRRSLEAFRDAGNVEQEAGALSRVGSTLCEMGELACGEQQLKRGLSLARKYGFGQEEAEILLNLGQALFNKDQYGRARQYLRQGLETLNEITMPSLEAAALLSLGRLALRQGDYGTASQYLSDGLTLSLEMDEATREAQARRDRGLLALRRGEIDTAIERLQDALDRARAINDSIREAECLAYLGRAAAERGEYQRAIQRCRTAVTIAEETGSSQLVADILRHLGHVNRAGERHVLAVECFARANRRYDRDDTPYGWANATIGLGDVARDRGGLATAHDHYRTALETIQEIEVPRRHLDVLARLAAVEAERDAERTGERWQERGRTVAADTEWLDAEEWSDRVA